MQNLSLSLRSTFNFLNLNRLSSHILREKSNIPAPPTRGSTTGYSVFLKECMKKLKQQTPSAHTSEYMKKAAVLWHKLSDKEKERYNEEGRRNLAAYQIDQQKYFESLTKEQKELMDDMKRIKKEEAENRKLKKARSDLGKKLKQLGMPTRPLSAFFAFLKENLEEQKTSRVKKEDPRENVRVLAEKWRKMSDEQKEVYLKRSMLLTEQYYRDIQAWRTTAAQKGLPDFTSRRVVNALSLNDINMILETKLSESH